MKIYCALQDLGEERKADNALMMFTPGRGIEPVKFQSLTQSVFSPRLT